MTGKHQLGTQILRWIEKYQASRAARRGEASPGYRFGPPHENCHCSFCEECRDITARSQQQLPISH